MASTIVACSKRVTRSLSRLARRENRAILLATCVGSSHEISRPKVYPRTLLVPFCRSAAKEKEMTYASEARRSGCLTAWLLLMILGGLIGALSYLTGGAMVQRGFQQAHVRAPSSGV